jgi:hypothetical protein
MIDIDTEADEDDEDDDFMSFINDGLTANMPTSHKMLPSTCNYNEPHLSAVQNKTDAIMKHIEDADEMSAMEELLCCTEASSRDFCAANLPADSMRDRYVPDKYKTELDLLLEQTRDESRLLRNPITTTSISSSDDVGPDDQIKALIMAAQDAAYLDKKYGSSLCEDGRSRSKKSLEGGAVAGPAVNWGVGACANNIRRRVVKEEQGGESEEESTSGRSYGSNISDESSLGESD